MRYLENIRSGERAQLGSHTFTADEIKSFARRFDPQPFHLDEEAAAHSHFGALCASGWHTCAVWMRKFSEYLERERKAGRGEAEMGPSPGFRGLKWHKPVYVGDTISYALEFGATRPSKSRAGWGLVTLSNTGTNQNGELVLSFVSTAFVGRKPA